MNDEPTKEITLIPKEAFATPPSSGGVRMRLWTRDFELVYDNVNDDASATDALTAAAAYLTVDTEPAKHRTRRAFAVTEIPDVRREGTPFDA